MGVFDEMVSVLKRLRSELRSGRLRGADRMMFGMMSHTT